MESGLLGSQNVSEFLGKLLAQRKASRKHYSLRALALALDLSPSMLSAVLKGKRNLSKTSAEKIASRFHLSSVESEYFLLLFDCEQVTHPRSRGFIVECLGRISSPS